MRIFIINPGSSSTKIALYEGLKLAWTTGSHHSLAEIRDFGNVIEQYEFRKRFILGRLEEGGIPLDFDVIMARGGLLKPLKGGIYEINDRMRHDLIHAEREHACNLGALIAGDMAEMCGCKAYIADPVVVDEMQPEARYTGIPGIERRSIFHALNQKAVSRMYAESIGRRYEDLNLVVAHLGGGISVGAHRKGQVIDVNNALDGEGPFTTERAGTMPSGEFAELCFSGKYTLKQVKQMVSSKSGLIAYLGTNDMITIASEAEQGNQPYKDVLDAMIYTVAKQIGAMYVALDGKVDCIILTGGIAHSEYCTSALRKRVEYLAPIAIRPGENEMDSLAYNAVGALEGTLPILEYR